DRFPLRLLVCAREPCGPHSGAARAPQSERPVAVRPALTLQRESVRALAAFLPFVTDIHRDLGVNGAFRHRSVISTWFCNDEAVLMVVAIIFYQQQAAMGRRCPTAHLRWRSARGRADFQRRDQPNAGAAQLVAYGAQPAPHTLSLSAGWQ